jgi:hypothetical protein
MRKRIPVPPSPKLMALKEDEIRWYMSSACSDYNALASYKDYKGLAMRLVTLVRDGKILFSEDSKQFFCQLYNDLMKDI